MYTMMTDIHIQLGFHIYTYFINSNNSTTYSIQIYMNDEWVKKISCGRTQVALVLTHKKKCEDAFLVEPAKSTSRAISLSMTVCTQNTHSLGFYGGFYEKYTDLLWLCKWLWWFTFITVIYAIKSIHSFKS